MIRSCQFSLARMIWALCALLAAAATAVAGEPPWAMKEGVFAGKIVLPDPTNPAVGIDITDEPCTVTVSRGDPGHMAVEVSFVGEAVQVPREGIRGGPFYRGDFQGETGKEALVVQTDDNGRVVVATHTGYDSAGDLNYGVSGTGEMFRECMMGV